MNVFTNVSDTVADPFVITLAQRRELKVVTGERLSNNPDTPKIPDVCNHYGVQWMNVLNMIQERGWRFDPIFSATSRSPFKSNPGVK